MKNIKQIFKKRFGVTANIIQSFRRSNINLDKPELKLNLFKQNASMSVKNKPGRSFRDVEYYFVLPANFIVGSENVVSRVVIDFRLGLK